MTKTGTKLAVSGVTATFMVSSVRSIVVNAGGGDDTVDLTVVSVPTKVSGGAGNDSLDEDRARYSEAANANFVLTNSQLTGVETDQFN